jgi:hypothetical protein
MTKDDRPKPLPKMLTIPDGEPPDGEDLARFRDFMREPMVINLEEGAALLRQPPPAQEETLGDALRRPSESSAEMVRPRTGPPFKVAIW